MNTYKVHNYSWYTSIGGLRARTTPWFFGHFWKCSEVVDNYFWRLSKMAEKSRGRSCSEPFNCDIWLTLFNYKFRSLKSLLSLYTLTSTCIFSILFYIHFLECWQEEFIKQSGVSLVGDHYSCYHNVNQEWHCKENLDSSHSKGVKG